MVNDLFKEKWEYERARLFTKLGWFDLLIGNFIFAFIVVKYTNSIYNYILNHLSFIPGGRIVQTYFSYLAFSLVLIGLGLLITFTLTKIYKKFFDNGGIT